MPYIMKEHDAMKLLQTNMTFTNKLKDILMTYSLERLIMEKQKWIGRTNLENNRMR